MATVEERMLAIEQALGMPYFKRNSELEAQIAALQSELIETKATLDTTKAELAARTQELRDERDGHTATKAQAETEAAKAQEAYRALGADLEAARTGQAAAIADLQRQLADADAEAARLKTNIAGLNTRLAEEVPARVLIDRLGAEYHLKIKNLGSVIVYKVYLTRDDEKAIGSVMLPLTLNRPMRLWVDEAWRQRGIMEQLLAHMHQDYVWDKSGTYTPPNELGQLMVDKYWLTPPTVRTK